MRLRSSRRCLRPVHVPSTNCQAALARRPGPPSWANQLFGPNALLRRCRSCSCSAGDSRFSDSGGWERLSSSARTNLSPSAVLASVLTRRSEGSSLRSTRCDAHKVRRWPLKSESWGLERSWQVIRADHEPRGGRRRAELRRARVLGGEAEQLSLAHDRTGRRRWPWIGCNEIESHVGSTVVVVVQPEVE
jgi:hypothetical protein